MAVSVSLCVKVLALSIGLLSGVGVSALDTFKAWRSPWRFSATNHARMLLLARHRGCPLPEFVSALVTRRSHSRHEVRSANPLNLSI